MARLFHRRLALPLWAVAFFAVALTASPPTALLLIILGIALMAFTTSGLTLWLRPPPSVVQVLSNGKRDTRSGTTTLDAGACVRTPGEENRSTTGEALDLDRMDDDGGGQVSRPPA